MKKFHSTSDGREILIAQMSDNHLMNTIDLHCRNLKNTLSMVDKYATLKESEKILYGYTSNKHEITKVAREDINIRTEALMAYCFEASLRGLDISKKLQDTYSRNAALPSLENNNIQKITESTETII